MRNIIRKLTCIIVFQTLIVSGLVAQPADRERVAEEQLQLDTQADRRQLEEPFKTGEGDVFLLRETALFEIGSNSALRFTDNAFLSDRREEDDFYLDEEIYGEFSTVVDQKVNVFARTGVSVRRYHDFPELDYDSPYVSLGFSSSAAGFVYGGNATGSSIWDPVFDENTINRGQLRGFIQRPIELSSSTSLFPSVNLSGSIADPSDFTNYQVSGRLTLLHRLFSGLRLKASANAYGRWYQDYFESIIGDSRRDIGGEIRGDVVWDVYDFAQIQGGIKFRTVNSSIGFLDYDELSGLARLSLTYRF